jgi:hypothetical protein
MLLGPKGKRMPQERGKGKYGRPAYNQAAKVIAKFGGEVQMANLLGVSRITIYRWQYAKPYGTDGMVPSSAAERLMHLARREGVLLTATDWLPERIDYSITYGATPQAVPPNEESE